MASDMSKWDSDMTLYLFTSLTAGSSHVVTATSRMETILKANRIPFTYIDTATNESAKKLYMRRGQGKKFPLLVKEGYFLGVSTIYSTEPHHQPQYVPLLCGLLTPEGAPHSSHIPRKHLAQRFS